MSMRATCWSITINNPGKADEDNINMARQKGWKVDGQLEKGKEGTPHYQLIVKTPQVRFSAVKKMFPRAHIEVARNVAALEQYVHKEETKEGELASSDERYPSLQTVWDMFADWLDEKYATSGGDLTNRHIAHDDKLWLSDFDSFIGDAIMKGYVVETIAINPQTRGCVKLYGYEIYIRSKVRRQTDRQTDEENISQSDINEDARQNRNEEDDETCSGEIIHWEDDEDYEDGTSSEASGWDESSDA